METSRRGSVVETRSPRPRRRCAPRNLHAAPAAVLRFIKGIATRRRCAPRNSHAVDPQVRFGLAAVALALAWLFSGAVARPDAKRPDPMSRRAWFQSALGVFFTTFLCPLISVWTMFVLPLGVAVALSSLTPLWSLPVGAWYGRPISATASVGAALATGGVACLAFAV